MLRYARCVVMASLAPGLLYVTAAQAQLRTVPLDGRLLPAPAETRLLPIRQAGPRVSPGVALLGSAILPGSGQYLLDSDRWVPFFALETWSWITWLNRQGKARDLTREYRDLAWFVGRLVSVGTTRRDTVFDYYEAMSKYSSSGLFDSDARVSGIQPELDATTYNGGQWALARSLFFTGGVDAQPGSPEYTRALQYYLEHAIPPSFYWAWGASDLEYQAFRTLIRRSDDAYRTATQVLGVILVNHVVSAVDALILARLRERGSGDGGPGLQSGFESGPNGLRWTVQASVRF